jgi:hypothetical protein
MRWSAALLLFVTSLAHAQVDMAVMLSRTNNQALSWAPPMLPPLVPAPNMMPGMGMGYGGGYQGGYFDNNLGYNPQLGFGYGGPGAFAGMYQNPMNPMIPSFMNPVYNAGDTSFLGTMMGYLPSVMMNLSGSGFCFTCSSIRNSPSSLDYIDPSYHSSSFSRDRDSDTEAGLSHERFARSDDDDSVRIGRNAPRDKLIGPVPAEDDAAAKVVGPVHVTPVGDHALRDDGRPTKSPKTTQPTSDITIAADLNLKNGQKVKLEVLPSRGKNIFTRAPIWDSFYANFKSCEPTCEPSLALDPYRNENTPATCHHGGRAIDIPAMQCSDGGHKAMTRSGQPEPRFAKMVACMKTKMKVIYFQPMTIYSKRLHRTLHRNITEAHHNHAHFSNGCVDKGRKMW